MGALRRHHPEMAPSASPASPEAQTVSRGKRAPKWLVVSGLLVYCSVFWMLIWAVGTFGVDMVRVATAGGQ